eukprot:TRINITY_DN1384_c0_g1_i2.p1 TRINITY_DN1384_c0_g1~~TRINITY_DN1384_c0_g1_i2.p1  ORF type:complete len:264 (-),score=17.02 TRINITY_DN1384_c0_g1_i2:461-1252(-)
MRKKNKGDTLYLEVPHVKQQHSWDCGVACTLMVLKKLNASHGINLSQLCQQFNTRSIWTIDIAHVLRKHGIDVTFYTVTIGANPEFANEKYYMLHISEDARRVESLFQQASSIGLSIVKRSVSMKEITQFMISRQYLIILLVDLRKISTWLSAADTCFMSTCCIKNGVGYQGHYIVLCGYDQHRSQLLYMDPGGRNGIQRQSVEAVEDARKSYGTDEDLLLINVCTPLLSNQQTDADKMRQKDGVLLPPGSAYSTENSAMFRA